MPRRPSPARVAARYAYIPGVRDPNGWEPGHVDADSEAIGYGSQVPPAHDQDGNLVDAEVDGKVVKNASMRRTAGVIQHVKDKSADKDDWAFALGGIGLERDIRPAFEFNQKELKPLLKSLRSCLVAMGHVASAYNTFVKIKSRKVSPDGQLGGKGYIQKIPDMRRALMNTVEALSSFTDTVYDEVNAPHWNPELLPAPEQEEVEEIKEDVQEIREDPEAWAEEQEDEMDEENGMGKTARHRRSVRRLSRKSRHTNRRLA